MKYKSQPKYTKIVSLTTDSQAASKYKALLGQLEVPLTLKDHYIYIYPLSGGSLFGISTYTYPL